VNTINECISAGRREYADHALEDVKMALLDEARAAGRREATITNKTQ